VCDYIPPIDQLILALKFGRRLSIASAIAELMVQATISTDELVDAAHLPDLLISVPLSQQRLSERGFNQSLEIAKPLAKALSIPLYPHLLYRNRHTQAQALLHPSQRRHNLHKAFTLNAGYTDKIAGQHIGVVDDVITTGATLHEIAVYLKRQGAAKITNLVFARTPPH
jgi:ComF family protein